MSVLATWPVLLTIASALASADIELPAERPRFRIEVPDFVLSNVPVQKVVITALNRDGTVDTKFQGRPLIEGIRLDVPVSQDESDLRGIVDGEGGGLRVREDAELPPFKNGSLELTTDHTAGRKVYITDHAIVVAAGTRQATTQEVVVTLRWFSLVPPLLAIVLAVWMRNVIIALFIGVWSGAVIYMHGDLAGAFVRTLDTYLIDELVEADDPGHPHMMIAMFTIFLGAMVGVISRSGGSRALVESMVRFTSSRERGQLMTMLLGFAVFFDDYANSLLLGSTMRPVTDRLRISREKLAFLVDSTAAPVAGLALVSTWVGVEIGYISDTYAKLGMSSEVYGTFLATIPYRFYALHLLVFVGLIAYMGRDYGPMLTAEVRAATTGQLKRGMLESTDDATGDGSAHQALLRNALVPLCVLLLSIVVGLWWTGATELELQNAVLRLQEQPELPKTLYGILANAHSNQVLLLASFLASAAAVASAVVSRSLTLEQSMAGWLEGARVMLLAVVILVLAWSIATLCDAEHLNTAGFLVELTQGILSVKWMPTVAFLLAAVVSFATGSSWSTMGLLMPLTISLTYYLLLDLNEAEPNHHLMLGAIGGVLAGSIFGDHCSPISDTTVLSSAACDCDHLDHVTTQIPYAISVGGVALVFGYIPVGFGYSPIILLPFGLIVLFLLVQFLGRPVEAVGTSSEKPETGDMPDLGDIESLMDE